MPRGGPGSLTWLVGLLALALLPLLGRAQAPVQDGMVVPIPATITTESTKRLQARVHGPLERFKAARTKDSRFTLVCDFNPGGPSKSENFGAALDLARYLRSLPRDYAGVRTVAFVHGDVQRHSVLAALACSEIIMSDVPASHLGKVTTADQPLEKHERMAYEDLTLNRYPAVLVRKMYDADLEVLRDGNNFHDASVKPRPPGQPVPELVRGDTAWFPAALAREFGLAQTSVRNTLDEVRALYKVPTAGPRHALDQVVAWRIPVGEVNRAERERVKRRVERALRARANIIVLDLKCPGGEGLVAAELGNYLASVNDKRSDDPVELIAFVTHEARTVAAFITFGCTKIVMQREVRKDTGVVPGARLGDFEDYIRKHPTLEAVTRELDELKSKPNLARQHTAEQQFRDGAEAIEKSHREAMAALLEKQQRYPRVLAEGFFRKGARLHFVESTRGSAERKLMLDSDFQADQKEKGARRWRSIKLLGPKADAPGGAYLTLTAEEALDLDLAAYLVEDFSGLCEKEGIDPNKVKEPDADWLEAVADFLRDPWTSVILVMVGITCLILELKMPGVGLPGVIAAICFVLFFWAHSQLNGQITWLAILLFVLGLALLGMEIFVLPGFGVCGISGILLVLASLGLVAYGHWPRGSAEWVSFGQKLGPFGVSMLGSLVCVFLVVRYLPYIPVLNRLMHHPAEDEDTYEMAPTVNPAYAELLGAIGVAATPLRPAGKTQFGSNFVDVVAEGGYIPPGRRVQVVEVEGNRVVVKEV